MIFVLGETGGLSFVVLLLSARKLLFVGLELFI